MIIIIIVFITTISSNSAWFLSNDFEFIYFNIIKIYSIDIFIIFVHQYVKNCTRLTERFNQTLVAHLMKFVNDDADNWDEFLGSVAFAYRIKRQESTKTSPFELLYGVPARLPVDLQNAADASLTTVEAEEGDVTAQRQRLQQFADVISGKRETARENIQAAQSSQKQRYDIKHKGQIFKVRTIFIISQWGILIINYIILNIV